MTILLGRRLNGRPMSVAPAASGGQTIPSSGYTLTQLATSGVWGAAVTYMTLRPKSGTWPAGTIILAISGVGGAFGNVVGATWTQNTFTPLTSSSVITLCLSVAKPGVVTVTASNQMGLIDPAPISFSVILSSAAPPALSDIVFHQPFPLDSAATDASTAGWLRPAGGIGPFTFLLPNAANEGYTSRDQAGYPISQDSSGIVYLFGSNPKPVGFTVQVTDSRGATMTKVFPVAVTSASPVISINQPNPVSNCTLDAYGTHPVFNGNSSVSLTYSLTKADGSASTAWIYNDGAIRYAAGGNTLAAGYYPLLVHASDSSGIDHPTNFTIQIVDYIATNYIEFTAGTVSTSMLMNSYVGTAAATTPNNTPTWTLVDSSNTFQIDSKTGVVSCAKQPATAGSTAITLSVTDATMSFSQNVSIQVQQGNTLTSSNMSFAGLTTTFNNDTTSNAIGTPTVSGVTGSQKWSLVSQTSLNPFAVTSNTPARYKISPTTGALTAPLMLSAELDGVSAATDTLLVSCTDGINTCTAPVNITVKWAPITTTYYVGRGMSTAHPGSGFETFAEARGRCMGLHSGTTHVLVYADADPDYYTNDNGQRTRDYALRFPWIGPIILEGVGANGKAMPRVGGPASNTTAGGTDMRGKGFIVIGDGDGVIKNMEFSACHDDYGDGYHGAEAIRKDGQTAGNMSVLNCYIHDCDNGILSGFGHQRLLVDSCLIENAGTSHVSSGACHGMYLGDVSEVVVRNTVSRHTNNGHLLKCRALKATVHDCRFFDGVGGSASACLEFPNGGQVEIYNIVVEKGTMAFGPDAIRYGLEGYIWETNNLYVHDSTVSVLTLNGAHFQPCSAVGFLYGTNQHGVSSMLTLTNNAIYLAGGANKLNLYGTVNSTVAETGTTMLMAPPAINQTRPDQSGSFPQIGFLFRMQSESGGSYNNINDVQQLGDREQIRIASTTATGTTICNVRASNDAGAIGAGTANPFIAGTTWSIIFDPTYYAAPSPWAASSKYTVGTNADGTAALQVAGALTSGIDNIQFRAKAPNGTLADFRYPVVVS